MLGNETRRLDFPERMPEVVEARRALPHARPVSRRPVGPRIVSGHPSFEGSQSRGMPKPKPPASEALVLSR